MKFGSLTKNCRLNDIRKIGYSNLYLNHQS
jgi:hypothetical protein